MDKKTLIMKQRETLMKYHTPGCNEYNRRPIDAIFLSPANSIEHEMAKCRMCYKLLKDGLKFVTEAVDNKTQERADIVVLDSGERIEIETDPKRAERFKGTDITVIKLWEDTHE